MYYVPLSQLQLQGSVWMSDVHTPVHNSPTLLLSIHVYVFFYGVNSSHTCFSSFPTTCTFPRIIIFSKEPFCLLVCSKEESFCFALLPPGMFQTSVLLGPTCSVFWWSRIVTELSSNTIFQVTQLFLPISLLHCPTFKSVHSNCKWEGMGDPSVGLWWQIFAVSFFFSLIFPLQPFQVSAFMK